MNLFDIILLSIFFGSIFLGIYRGFLGELINIIKFILLILFIYILYPLIEEVIIEYVSNTIMVNISTLILSYLISSFAANWIKRRLNDIAEKYEINGIISRFIGLWFGAFKGFFLAISLFVIIGIASSASYIKAKNYWEVFANIKDKNYPKWVKSAKSYNITLNSYMTMKEFFTGSFIETGLKELEIPREEEKENNKNTDEDLEKEIENLE